MASREDTFPKSGRSFRGVLVHDSAKAAKDVAEAVEAEYLPVAAHWFLPTMDGRVSWTDYSYSIQMPWPDE